MHFLFENGNAHLGLLAFMTMLCGSQQSEVNRISVIGLPLASQEVRVSFALFHGVHSKHLFNVGWRGANSGAAHQFS